MAIRLSQPAFDLATFTAAADVLECSHSFVDRTRGTPCPLSRFLAPIRPTARPA